MKKEEIKDSDKTYDSVHDLIRNTESGTKWDRFVDKIHVFKWKIIYAYQRNYYRYFGRKHHLIDTKLQPCPWIDSDARMLHGMMNLLVDFVNNESNRVAWELEPEYNRSYQEMLTIKAWWENYPNQQKEIESSINKWWEHCRKSKEEGYSEEEDNRLLEITSSLEKKLSDEEQEMLTRLVKIRQFLWS